MWKCYSKSFIWQHCTRHIDVWEKIRRDLSKWRLLERKQCAYFGFLETKSVIKTQRRYRTKYGKDSPSDNVIRRWLKQFPETGSIVVAIETITPQMLENTWREIEYRSDILCDMKGSYVEVV
jgi:hypothetical protein